MKVQPIFSKKPFKKQMKIRGPGMSVENKIKALCPYCNGEKNCHIVGQKERKWNHDDGDNYFWAECEYYLLECLGCDGVFTLTKSQDSENYDIERGRNGDDVIRYHEEVHTYPTPEQESVRPKWLNHIMNIDFQLHAIFNEMYTAYQNKSFILASIGLRTIFDRTTEILEIHPSLTLGEKVEALKDEGYVGETERDQLNIVTEAGNAAAHRGWSPNEIVFKSLLDVIENFVYRTLVKRTGLSAISVTIPQKPKRQP
ncbi:DUF4145 domain-containing protein, partial [Rahnella aceris]